MLDHNRQIVVRPYPEDFEITILTLDAIVSATAIRPAFHLLQRVEVG